MTSFFEVSLVEKVLVKSNESSKSDDDSISNASDISHELSLSNISYKSLKLIYEIFYDCISNHKESCEKSKFKKMYETITINLSLVTFDEDICYNTYKSCDSYEPYIDSVNSLIKTTNDILHQIHNYIIFKIYIKDSFQKILKKDTNDIIEAFLLTKNYIKYLVLQYIETISSLNILLKNINKEIIEQLDEAHWNFTGGSPRWVADETDLYIDMCLYGINSFDNNLKPLLLKCLDNLSI